MSESRDLVIEPLSEAAVNALLARSRLGRMAYVDGRLVDIRPLAYVRDGGWIFGRMALGTKVEALLHHPWVAFQVDEIRSPWDWESVVIRGPVHFLDEEAGEEARRLRARALAALEREIPGFGTEADPGAFRTLLFGILPQETRGMRGRSAGTP